MNQPFSIFFKSLVKASLLIILLYAPILLFNILIDPYRIFTGWYHCPVEPNKRYLKMQHITANPDKFDSFIFGNSRINAFDPALICGGNYYNMTYSIGVPENHYEDILNMLKQGVKIKNVIIGLDQSGLLDKNEISPYDLLRKKYPETLKEKIDFYKAYLFHRPSLEFAQSILTGQKQDWSTMLEKGIVVSQTDSIIHANPIAHAHDKLFERKTSPVIMSPNIEKNLNMIEKIKDLSIKHNFNLTIFINPVYHSSFTNSNLAAYFQALKNLAAITPFYDFSGYNGVTLEKWYYAESSHYRRIAANWMIYRMCQQSDSIVVLDFGRLVNKENIDAHLEHHIKGLEDYFSYSDASSKPMTISPLVNAHLTSTLPVLQILKINQVKKDQLPPVITSPLLTISGKTLLGKMNSDLVLYANGQYFPIMNYVHGQKTSQSSNSDWECRLPARWIGQGEHTIVVGTLESQTFHAQDSIRLHFVDSFAQPKPAQVPQLSGGKSLVMIESKEFIKFDEKTNSKYGGMLHLSGWAAMVSDNTPPASIIFKNDAGEFYAPFRAFRPDVSGHFTASSNGFYGFEGMVPVKRSANQVDNHLSLVLLGEDGYIDTVNIAN
jgi:hypothetical protein